MANIVSLLKNWNTHIDIYLNLGELKYMQNKKSMDNQQKIEKYKLAWEKFQTKMAELKKRQHEILTHISEDLDRQRMEKLKKQLENHE